MIVTSLEWSEAQPMCDCLFQQRGEPKLSTALAPHSSRRKNCIEKVQKQPPRSLRAGTAQRGAPIFYRARAGCIFPRRAVSARVSPRHWGRQLIKMEVSNNKLLIALRDTQMPIWPQDGRIYGKNEHFQVPSIWKLFGEFRKGPIKIYRVNKNLYEKLQLFALNFFVNFRKLVWKSCCK